MTWIPIAPVSNTWTQINGSSNTWTQTSQVDNTWNVTFLNLYVYPLYWVAGYCDDGTVWGDAPIADNTWIEV